MLINIYSSITVLPLQIFCISSLVLYVCLDRIPTIEYMENDKNIFKILSRVTIGFSFLFSPKKIIELKWIGIFGGL